MLTRDTDLDDFLWPERDEPDDETRTVIALLSFIGGGFSDGQQALAKAAAEDADVTATFALSLLSRHAGPGSRSDHFWEVRRVSGRLQYRLVSPA
ncbi:MAG: hypothetical protein ACI9YM_000185 [Brevundimonas sp.]|jgi:hypothetical protein|uniref:hypothetical protein n=1 Tax=Brevundimonas sp. TaxID=1871086 RepID=UPI0039E3FA20